MVSTNTPRILLWFRNDLRLQDHEPLFTAVKARSLIIPFYCFDPRHFAKTAFGFPKTGAFRAQFLLESIANLRQNLQNLGSDLLIRQGLPEQIIPAIATQLDITEVYFHQEITSEETQVEESVKQALQALKRTQGIKTRSFWGHTLHHPDDLPFDLSKTPELFTNFRKQVEQNSSLRLSLPAPKTLPKWQAEHIDLGEMPSLKDWGLSMPDHDSRAVLRFQGGEKAGGDRLQDYFWTGDHLRVYKETRNGMVGANYSAKFSPWLAHGCLSPRVICQEIQRYETERVANDSTYWLIFELLWRDYFRFIASKHGDRLFYASGLQKMPIPWKQDWQRFELWQTGETGFPLVDANMRELSATGFMSNRGRQNVASFLTKNLGIDWRMGAEWFESLLIDYDVCSNWGNWNYTAGVGNDARGFRFFNILKQSHDYDSDGMYVRHWLPELSQLPAGKVHEPGKLLAIEQKRFGVTLGVDYPHPVVDLFQSAKANQKIYELAVADFFPANLQHSAKKKPQKHNPRNERHQPS